MKSSARVTHKQIAEVIGVHRATVSLALKGHHSISPALRKRIKALAKKMGYSPDPMLSALAAYRQQNQKAGFKGVLGWLGFSTKDYRWNEIPLFQSYFEGARRAAERFGYEVSVFGLGNTSKELRRLASILRARNISGLLLAPQPQAASSLIFPWEYFSAVTFGYTLAEPSLHLVSSTQLRAVVLAMQKLREHGYQRIGFAFSLQHDERADHNYLAGYLLECRLNGAPALVATATDYRDPKGSFHQWLRDERVDVILTGNYNAPRELEASGLRVPEDIAVACPSLPNTELGVAGVIEDAEAIGETAVNVLVAAIQRGERGVPKIPQRILIEGRWVMAPSIRRRRRNAKHT